MATDAQLRFRLRELLHDIQFGLRFRRPRISDWEQAVEILRKFGMGRDADRLERGCRSVSQGRKPTAELAEFVLSLHRCFQVNEQGADVGRSVDRPPKRTPVAAKPRNVSEKSERAIAQAIRKLPKDATQAQVAKAARVHVKTVRASVAWAQRIVTWGIGACAQHGLEAIENRDQDDKKKAKANDTTRGTTPDRVCYRGDEDAFLDAKEATMNLKRHIDAGDKLPGFHHKTKKKLIWLIENPNTLDALVSHLAIVEAKLADQGETLFDLDSKKTQAAYRYAAEVVT